MTIMPPRAGGYALATMPTVEYDFAVLRVVPHPHVGSAVPVGVVLHARAAEFLGMRVLSDAAELSRRIADVDVEMLARYLCGRLRAELAARADASHLTALEVEVEETFGQMAVYREEIG